MIESFSDGYDSGSFHFTRLSVSVIQTSVDCGLRLCKRGAVVQWLARPLVTPGFAPQTRNIIRCKNLALYIRDCVSLCLSDETLKAVGPFYLVSMPGEVKDPTSLHWKCVTCRGLHNTTLYKKHSCVN